MITELIGRICFNRHEAIYWSVVGRRVLENAVQDPIWRKIGRRLINQANAFYREALVKQLLMNAADHEQVEWFLGTDLNDERNGNCSTIRHLLTNKFLLISYSPAFENQRLIENTIGYLAHRANRELFESTLHNVLSVWSNATLVRHQTTDQHNYLCRILACSLRHMMRLRMKLDSGRFLSVILHGGETHLKMVEPVKRNSGLFMVQKLVNYLHADNEKMNGEQLDFEIDLNDAAVRYLNAILEGKSEALGKGTSPLGESKANTLGKPKDKKEEDEAMYDYEPAIGNDDEDDLVPYDMSGDVPVIKTKRPIYLKDCLEGLMNSEDVEYNSTCLDYLPELIEKNPWQARELNVDFIRVLLFLDCEDEDERKQLRFRSMVKLCNLDPDRSAQYLTSQVYDQNLSIVRKLDVLDIMVESARQLSSGESAIDERQTVKSIQNIVRQPRPEYEKIIEERVKAKTRYLCPTSKAMHKLPAGVPNGFVPHVNEYFYPLIANYDKADVTLKFHEDDYFVLGRLIVTLAELLKAVSQTHLTRKMAVALIDFLNVFRNHPESYVRKSITIAIHSILSHVPSFFLFEDLQADLLSFRDFLVGLKQIDPETFHSHGVLALYTLQEQLNDYQASQRSGRQMKEIKI